MDAAEEARLIGLARGGDLRAFGRLVDAHQAPVRAFLRRLEGGCQVPIGAFAVLEAGELLLKGFVGSPDGARVIRDSMRGAAQAAENLGTALAEKCLAAGAGGILAEARAAAAENAAGEVV